MSASFSHTARPTSGEKIAKQAGGASAELLDYYKGDRASSCIPSLQLPPELPKRFPDQMSGLGVFGLHCW